jgi:hypothetical protein
MFPFPVLIAHPGVARCEDLRAIIDGHALLRTVGTCHTRAEVQQWEEDAQTEMMMVVEASLIGTPGVSDPVLGSRPVHGHTVVLGTSAHDAVRAWDVGAAEFLVEPVSPEGMHRALVKVASRRLSEMCPDAGTWEALSERLRRSMSVGEHAGSELHDPRRP